MEAARRAHHRGKLPFQSRFGRTGHDETPTHCGAIYLRSQYCRSGCYDIADMSCEFMFSCLRRGAERKKRRGAADAAALHGALHHSIASMNLPPALARIRPANAVAHGQIVSKNVPRFSRFVIYLFVFCFFFWRGGGGGEALAKCDTFAVPLARL